MLIVLVGFAVGGLWGFKGGVIVVTKDSFANTLSQYDDFRAGALFKPESLAPFDFTVHDFDVTFIRAGREAGMAHKFAADLTYRPSPAARRPRPADLGQPPAEGRRHRRVPAQPRLRAAHHRAQRRRQRRLVRRAAFLPEDSTFRSFGVVKVPDAHQASGTTQIGLEGEFYPTYAFTKASGPFSAFPDDKNPAISMVVWTGDLGLDNGQPQSVYTLDKKGLSRLRKATGQQVRLDLAAGRTAKLPDGLGSVTFDGVSRYVKLQVSHTPGQVVALAGVVLALIGLLGSLFIRPRRLWVRARREGGRTLVEIAGLDRSSGGDLAAEVAQIRERLQPVTTAEQTGDAR